MVMRSMRVRLTLLFIVMFAAAQILLWFVADRVRTRHTFDEIDRQLILRGQDMIEAIRTRELDPDAAGFANRLAKVLEPFEASGFYFELRRPDGTTVHNSHSLTGYSLPIQTDRNESKSAGARPDVETIACTWDDPLIGRGGKLRLTTLNQVLIDSKPFRLKIATNLQPTLEAIGQSRRLLVVFGVVGLVLAGLITWYVVGRSLAPLTGLVRSVRRVSASGLQQRDTIDHLDDEVGEAIEAVDVMLERLEREFHALERFVSNIAHELKTPLVVLVGEVREFRKKHAEEGPSDEFAEMVTEECRKLLRTIESFLILARTKSQVRLPPTAAVSLEDIVLASVQAQQPEAGKRAIRLLPQFDADDAVVEPCVAGDSDLLRAMFDNLIQNAVRYSAESEAVEIRVSCSAKEAKITVRDRGPGIPEEDLDHVFERFRQFDSDKKRAGTAGLGLAIVESVASLHGGHASVRNVDPGCEFTVTLPLAPVAE